MKKRFLCLIQCCLPLLLLSQTDSSYKGIKWTTGLTWAEVKDKAKKENKYIFLDCYATWCGPCKQMDKNVYTNEKVGNILNEKFISVKIQCDSTSYDTEETRNWYTDAHLIQKEYKLKGYPTFLFFTPAGILIYREIGYKEVSDFIGLSKIAVDPKRIEIYAHLKDYQNGVRNYSIMPHLEKAASEILRDSKLSAEIAKEYKVNYFDNLVGKELLTKVNVDFITRHFYLVSSNDKIFRIMYDQPGKIDTIANKNGVSEKIVSYVISKEEIDKKLWKDNKPITTMPRWDEIKTVITSKYSNWYAENLVDRSMYQFYSRTKNWSEYAKLIEKALIAHPPKKGGDKFNVATGGIDGWGDAWALNGFAWDFFLGCKEMSLLKKAL
jgi:thioredoxin-related protein